jgi:hypothetical protein
VTGWASSSSRSLLPGEVWLSLVAFSALPPPGGEKGLHIYLSSIRQIFLKISFLADM